MALQGDLKKGVCFHKQSGMVHSLNELNSLKFKLDFLSGTGRVEYDVFYRGLGKFKKEYRNILR